MRAAAIQTGLCALLVAIGGWPTSGSACLTVRVSPVSAHGPCDVTIEARIEPHPLNRSISFVVESGEFLTSSTTDLEGERAPRTAAVRFRSVPAGNYEIRVTLTGADGERGNVVRTIELW
jgi:hypothetical protein